MCSPQMNVHGHRAPFARSGAHVAVPRQAGPALDVGRSGEHAAAFAHVERLAGNVGYLELVRFAPVDEARRGADAVMETLTGSEALVIDLRRNRGGDPRTAALITSYLFDTAPLSLDEVYEPSTHDGTGPRLHAGGDRGGPAAQRPAPTPTPARRYVQQHLCLLIGPGTSTLGRAFARNLEALRRATIVEEAA